MPVAIPLHYVLDTYGRSREHKERIILQTLQESGTNYYRATRNAIPFLHDEGLSLSAALAAVDHETDETKRRNNRHAIRNCHSFLRGKKILPYSKQLLFKDLHLSPVKISYRPISIIDSESEYLIVDYYLRRSHKLQPGAEALAIYISQQVLHDHSFLEIRPIMFDAHRYRTIDLRHLALQDTMDLKREWAEIELAAMKAYEVFKENGRKPRKPKEQGLLSDQMPLPFVNH